MATGINTVKMNALKVDLLSYVESINKLKERLEGCVSSIRDNLIAPGSTEIINQLNNYNTQFSNVSSNISTYIQTLSKIEKKFVDNDEELASDIIHDINKLDL